MKQLENGSIRFILLNVIRQSQNSGGIYGYGIAKSILEQTEGEIDASNATFYAILRRMEQDNLIFSELGESKEGPIRKHYFLTELGFEACNLLKMNWDYYYGILQKVNKKTEELQ